MKEIKLCRASQSVTEDLDLESLVQFINQKQLESGRIQLTGRLSIVRKGTQQKTESSLKVGKGSLT
jgi:hypothetical protein